MKTENNLKLEWTVSPSKSGWWHVCPMTKSVVQVVDDHPLGKWLWYVNRDFKGSKDTLLEAQQAAETALKDALKPCAELYARLGGEI
jgi:hypothetical protein